MNHKEIIAQTLQNYAPTAINMHKIDNHFIMDINYDVIVNAIVDNLICAGYTIINKQQ